MIGICLFKLQTTYS